MIIAMLGIQENIDLRLFGLSFTIVVKRLLLIRERIIIMHVSMCFEVLMKDIVGNWLKFVSMLIPRVLQCILIAIIDTRVVVIGL
jgi:hypothetical protein